MSRNVPRSLLLATLVVGVSQTASAQGWLSKAKAKVKAAVEQRADSAITCTVTDQACLQRASAQHHGIVITDANGKRVSTADSAAAIAAASGQASAENGSVTPSGTAENQPPGTGAWLNYDFVPGDRVLFYDDFANDHVGDLPTHEDVTDGNVTIVELKGKKYLRTTTGATVWINLPESVPKRFTIEATYFSPQDNNPLRFTVGGDKDVTTWCYHGSAGVSGAGANGDKKSDQDAQGIGANDLVHCRFMFDGGYVKAYLNEQRLGQLNGLVFDRPAKVKIDVPPSSSDNVATLVTDIRIAEGGKPLYDALTASGRVSTHGILFATGSATIEGESTPTLKEIGDMLSAHPDLKLTIEGHTDDVGDVNANQKLSEQRAAAVAQYLEQHFKVDASRLATKGYGSTKPVASNDTPEGRQQNRRVELVKM